MDNDYWMPRRLTMADLDAHEAERLPVKVYPWAERQGRAQVTEPAKTYSLWSHADQMPIPFEPMTWRREIWQICVFGCIAAWAAVAVVAYRMYFGG